RPVGSSSWSGVGTIGAVYATHYWALIMSDGRTQRSYGSTNPAEHFDGERVNFAPVTDCSGEYCTSHSDFAFWRWTPHPYSLGQPWQGRAPDPFISGPSTGIRMYGARQTPTRQTASWAVPKGQYEVRIRKVTGDVKD